METILDYGQFFKIPEATLLSLPLVFAAWSSHALL